MKDSVSKDAETLDPNQEVALYTNSEVWFRAATIAIPVCGFVILMVLVVLALKILRSESRDDPNQKLG